MNASMEKATHIAGEIYSAFLQQVVESFVLKERIGALSEEARKRMAKETHIDPRVLRLMAISGKGGWVQDTAKWQRYELNTNVTLLDHLLSVVRGALLLYALDKLSQNSEMSIALLEQRLRVMAVIAFLHDLDKLLGLERNTRLPLDEVEDAVHRYGLTQFLSPAQLSAEQIRYLIELVEDTQRHRSPPVELPPRDVEPLMGYIALADKLDGIWLSSDPEKGGLSGVLHYLSKTQTLRADWLQNWRILDLFDPHHPFLLDELQRWLSWFSFRLTGVLPLIEIHHDGRLFMLLPTAGFEAITDRALRKFCADLPFPLELMISKPGFPALYNGQPTHQALQDFIADLPLRKVGRLFQIKADLQTPLTHTLDALLGSLGLAPRWPRTPGALVSLYATLDSLNPDTNTALRKAAHLALLLNLKAPTGKKAGLPDYAQREQTLLQCINQERPDWLEMISNDTSRRTLTALWALVLSRDSEVLETAIWGENGLLQRWLEGENDQPGFNRFIEGRGAVVTTAVERHFRQLLSGQRVTVADDQAEGRCIFTDEPVAFDEAIDEAVGLYEVRVSAFSGRDHRPESITSERAHTNVGPVSLAEYKLRAHVHSTVGGQADGVPTLIYSPSTSGLFGGLGLTADRALGALSLYDISRQEIKKGCVYQGIELYRGRYRLARFERMADKTSAQIDQLRMLLQASRRLGRPIHLFRGLPTPQRAFFYYDAMPCLLADLIGGHSLRLEQISDALEQLQLAQLLLETPGLGYDLLMQYAHQRTRFGALCLAGCHLHDELKKTNATRSSGVRFAWMKLERHFNHLVEDHVMNEQDGPLVRLGKAAARIQRRPMGPTSTSEEMRVFKLCLDLAENALVYKQTDVASLINGIASDLEINLVRKNEMAASTRRDSNTLQKECLEVAGLFVHEVWNGILKGRSPTQRARRTLGSIYRMSFLNAHRDPTEKLVDSAQTTDIANPTV